LKLSYATSSKTQVRRNRTRNINENNNQGFGPRLTRNNRPNRNRGNRGNRSNTNNNFGPRLTRRNNFGPNNFDSAVEPKFTRESGYGGFKSEFNKPGQGRRYENEVENVSF
jgi:hypothetical protein